MISKIKKWGNSLAVRIPKPLAEEVSLTEDSSIKITVKDGTIIIEPAAAEYELKDLLSKVKESNIHEEYKYGKSEGKELL